MEKPNETSHLRDKVIAMEVEVKNLQTGVDIINNSMRELHGKFDNFSTTITQNYVSRDTFEEYKKNRMLERIIVIMITAVITGLIAFFLRENNV